MRVLVIVGGILMMVCTAWALQDASTKKEKLSGRLPPYYEAVVTPEQRQQIYRIQQKYESQIRELEKQIEELKRKRDQEIESILNDEQRELVRRLRALHQKLRSKNRKNANPTSTPQSQK